MPNASIFDVFDHTNWPLLRDQKEALIAVIDSNRESNSALEGILSFLDAVQDAAADNHGYHVFETAEADSQG